MLFRSDPEDDTASDSESRPERRFMRIAGYAHKVVVAACETTADDWDRRAHEIHLLMTRLPHNEWQYALDQRKQLAPALRGMCRMAYGHNTVFFGSRTAVYEPIFLRFSNQKMKKQVEHMMEHLKWLIINNRSQLYASCVRKYATDIVLRL